MKNLERWIFIPDMHIPYEDERFWKLILMVCKKLKPHGIVIGGDFIDCYDISFFAKDPNRKTKAGLENEIDKAKIRLAELKKLGAKKNIYIMGNHEYRFERYVAEKAPAIASMVKDLATEMGLHKNGWVVVPYRKSIRLGGMRITHDVGSVGKYAHYRAADAFQHSNLTFHTHRAGVTYFGTLENETKVSAMLGWGGEKEAADYAGETQKKDWVHGFGWGYHAPDSGVVYVNFIPSVNYTCVVDGLYFEAPFTKKTVKKELSYADIVSKTMYQMPKNKSNKRISLGKNKKKSNKKK